MRERLPTRTKQTKTPGTRIYQKWTIDWL